MNLDAVEKFRVLVVGDAIVDRYVFVRSVGKSMKESVLSVGFIREEEYRGGIWAAAGHLETLCEEVNILHGRRVMVNTRYVEESNPPRKMLTIHQERDVMEPAHVHIPSYDVVIVADFGHGTMTTELIERVSREARFLAVNAQTNSTNFGFNLITKYRRADYVVVDKIEAQLAAQDNVSPIEDVIVKLGYKSMVVTMGSEGAVGFDGREFYRAPALTDRVVDTMGAGDAFLAVSSVFAAARFPIRDLVTVGNMAGAAKVGVLGHQRAIGRSDLEPRN